jgi:hypothetical protein
LRQSERVAAALPTPDEAASRAQGEAIAKIVAQLEITLLSGALWQSKTKALQQAQRSKVPSHGIGFVLPDYNKK